MDKRIFELASQAGFSSWVLSPSKETMSDTPELLSKFAELIVQECIGQCNRNDPRPDAYSDMAEFAESRKVRECIDSIKRHFGVE